MSNNKVSVLKLRILNFNQTMNPTTNFFFFFGSTQGLEPVWQVLYHLSHTSNPNFIFLD
jgi:hypothetical protein